MIAHLRGRLVSKDPTGVVIDCAGVGYGVAMSLSSLARLGAEGSEISVHAYTHVGQDVLRLYGFVDLAEKRMFQVLVSTKGVGPKLALAVLSTMSSAELGAVVGRSDVAALVRIPGVGKKTAERLLIELRDRLPPMDADGETASDLREDLVSALVNLGFGRALAEKAADQALDEHAGEEDLTVLVRAALRKSTKTT